MRTEVRPCCGALYGNECFQSCYTRRVLEIGIVVGRIAALAKKYKDDYGIEPFDVCLGPREFDVVYKEGRTASERPPDWHYKLAPMFYSGMRIRLMNTPGVLVGTLTDKPLSFDIPKPIDPNGIVR